MREKAEPHAIIKLQALINDTIGHSLPPGPAFIPWYMVINFQKAGTLPYVIGLMYYFDHWSTPAYFYAAAHGSYGIVWLLKHFVIPDGKVRSASKSPCLVHLCVLRACRCHIPSSDPLVRAASLSV